MRANHHNELAPALATSYSLSGDGCQYTFTLRDAYWSNGEKITAHDFERSMKEILSPDFMSDYAFILFVIKNAKLAKEGHCSLDQVGIYALDDHTLCFDLEQPTPYFLDLTAFPTFFPVFSGADEVYSGPFRLKNLRPEYSLRLKRNPSYWDASSVTLSELHFSIISDNTTEALLFEQGKLDWLGQPLSQAISSEILGKLKNKLSYDVAGSSWLTFNKNCPSLEDGNLRKALTMSINRTQLITHVLQGGQKVATSFLPPSIALHDPKLFFTDGNLTEAQALCKESFPAANLPTLTLTFPNSHRIQLLMQVIQQQIKEGLGIHLVLDGKEPHLFRQAIKKGAFEIAYGEWIADFHDPISFLEIFTKPPYSHSLAESTLNQLNEFLTKASKETESDKRLFYLEEAEVLLMNEMVVAPLFHYCFDYAKKPCVHNVLHSPLGLSDFKYAYVQRR